MRAMWRLVAIGLCVLMCTGCGINADEQKVNVKDESTFGVEGPPVVDTVALPTAENETARMRSLVVTLAQEVEAISPVGPWDWVGLDNPMECPDGPNGKSWNVSSASYGSAVSIPAEDWDSVIARISSLVEAEGLSFDTVLHNEPGNRDLRATSPDGRQLRIGDRGLTTLSFETGCRRSETGSMPDLPEPPGYEPESGDVPHR